MKLSLSILALAAILNNGVNARSRVPRIVGGSRVNIENAPYIVMLRDYRAGTSNRGHICGGTIIGSRHILTAAHCISEGYIEPGDIDELDNLIVVAGEEIYGDNDKFYEVDEIYLHPNFHGDLPDLSKDRGDVAVIKLAEEIPFTSNQQSIELAEQLPATKSRGLITGWGSGFWNGPHSRSLQGLTLEYYSVAACAYAFPFSAFTPDEICAKPRPGTDSCSGDSGGPFVVNHKLLGIISHGIRSCDGSKPSALASIPYYKSWIEDAVKGKIKPVYPTADTTSTPGVPYDCSPQNPTQTERRRYRLPFEKRRRNRVSPRITTPVPMKYM